MINVPLSSVVLLLAQAGTNAPAAGNPLVVWGIVLIGLALALFIVELFLPTGGIIGFLSAASLVAGVVMFFRVDTTLGLISALVVLAALPFFIGFALKIWPDTWIAQMLTLKNEAPVPAGDAVAAPPRADLIGKRGTAVTDLRPVGICLIDGKREECLAHGGLIHAGAKVEVITASGLEIKVKAL